MYPLNGFDDSAIGQVCSVGDCRLCLSVDRAELPRSAQDLCYRVRKARVHLSAQNAKCYVPSARGVVLAPVALAFDDR